MVVPAALYGKQPSAARARGGGKFKSLNKGRLRTRAAVVSVGMAVAEVIVKGGSKFKGDEVEMREIADEFMKLLAVIMVLVTLAVSTAAFSMMFG